MAIKIQSKLKGVAAKAKSDKEFLQTIMFVKHIYPKVTDEHPFLDRELVEQQRPRYVGVDLDTLIVLWVELYSTTHIYDSMEKKIANRNELLMLSENKLIAIALEIAKYIK